MEDPQQLLELYKESLESVLTCLQDKTCSADKFAKLQELQKKIPSQTDCEDSGYKGFVKTSNFVREQLDTHIRKVDDCGLVLKRIWGIRKKHKDKMKDMSTTLTTEEEKSHLSKYFKVLIDMEKMIESIGKMDEIPVNSPDDATSQSLSQERNETEKRQQPITNEQEMNTEEDKEPQNEDVVKDDGSKLREESYKTKTELDDMTEVHNSQKEEENGMIKELEKLRNECDRLEAKVKKLVEMNTGLKDENERYKMHEKEYNKVTEENTAYEQRCKAYDNYISRFEDENGHLKKSCKKFEEDYNEAVKEKTTLQQRLKSQGKCTKETERSEQRSLRPQTAPHSSARQYKELQNQIATLTAEKESLMQRCKVLKKQTNRLKEENTDLQERLDRPQAPPSVQMKELQKRIESMTTENESLIKRLKAQEKYTKEKERSEQMPQRPKTAPHSSARQYTELQNQIATLTAEKESLMQRLSMVAGMKMRDNNPGIADLSDPNRPEKIAEQFREMYDNAWTNLLDYITENTKATDDIAVQQIVTATQKIFEKCQKEIGEMKLQLLKSIGYPEDTFEKQYTGGKDGHDPVVKMMKDLVQISAERIYERVHQKIKEIGEIKTILQTGGKSADLFLTKCSKLCLFMCVKDPPVVLDFNFKRGDSFDKDKLSAFTRAGDSVDYLVWPVMYLNENGPVMSKGVAQGRKK